MKHNTSLFHSGLLGPRLPAVFATLVMLVLVAACSDSSVATEEVGAIDVDEFEIDQVPACDSLPEWRPSQEADFTEAELIGLMEQAFPILGTDSGLQGAGIGNVNRVGLEFVDPPADELPELLALLPEGFCLEAVLFTPDPPDSLDVISDSGDVSELPESVAPVEMWLDSNRQPVPGETTFVLWLHERACAGGQPMGERLLGPEVYESDTEILIAAAVSIQLTGQTCPSNPATETTVSLDAPIGNRTIRNAITGQEIEISDRDF